MLAKIEQKLLPHKLARALGIRREKRELDAIAARRCNVASLGTFNAETIRKWFAADLSADWQQVEQTMAAIKFGGGSGAVNPGDRRALYYLARALQPRSILEVGTHVGASTSMLALALRRMHGAAAVDRPRLVTVDITEVNDPVRGAWKRIGCSQSPADVLRTIGCQDLVSFVASPSIPYLQAAKERFDLIFLDGDHAAPAVYQEIPGALELLSPGGAVLLHDYFPNHEPLWSDGAVVPGPDLAVERLRRENNPIIVWPFGRLPWPTKLDSSVSSLALVSRAP